MVTERQTRALLRELAEESVAPEDAATIERRRRRVVAATSLAIAREANAGAQRRRLTRVVAWTAAAAGVVAVAGAAWLGRSALRGGANDGAPVADGASVAHGEVLAGALLRGHPGEPLAPLGPHEALGAGDEVATDKDARGQVVLTDGVAITLEAETRLRLPSKPDTREEVSLALGTVRVHVPPMPAGHTFSIRTPDAEVTVHGTSFVVHVEAPTASVPKPTTHVSVTTGVVTVSSSGHEALLTAGMEWGAPAAPDLPAAAPQPSAPETPTAADKTASRPPHRPTAGASGAPSVPPAAAAPPKSRLGEENQLLAQAIAASKTGDYAGAVATLDDFLRRFPASTLAQEAHVQRFRALAHAADAAGAAREARLYLALYPSGFAREEARAIAVGW